MKTRSPVYPTPQSWRQKKLENQARQGQDGARGRKRERQGSTPGVEFLSQVRPSTPIKIERVAAAFPVILNGLDFFRFPVLEFEIVRDDARSFLELLVENG